MSQDDNKRKIIDNSKNTTNNNDQIKNSADCRLYRDNTYMNADALDPSIKSNNSIDYIEYCIDDTSRWWRQ